MFFPVPCPANCISWALHWKVTIHPILFKIGPLTVHTYGALYALGILAAIILSDYLFKRDGGKAGVITDIAFPVVIGVLIGARGLFIFVEREYYFRHPAEIPMIWNGGLVFYGGLIGGILAFIIMTRLKKIELWRLADTVAPGIALGHGIGRIGCLFAGSCYGRPTDVPWAVTYTDLRSLAVDILGIPVHPTQLYSSLFLLALSAILVLKSRRPSFKGQVFTIYLIAYGTFRFAVEFLRGDPRGEATLLGVTLSTSQWISMILVPLAITAYLYLFRKGGTVHGSGEVLLQN